MRETSDGRSRTPSLVARRASSIEQLAVGLFRIVGFGIDKLLLRALVEGEVEELRWKLFAVRTLRCAVTNPTFAAFQSCIHFLDFALPIAHGPLTTVEILHHEQCNSGRKFNADDLLSAVFKMRYLEVSNPSQDKNPGSNPGIANNSLALFG